MAILAMARVTTPDFIDGDVYWQMILSHPDGRTANCSHGPVAITTTFVTMMVGLAASAKASAESEFDIEFGVLDTIHIVHPTSAIL